MKEPLLRKWQSRKWKNSSLSHVDQHQMPELVPCFPSSTVSIPVTPQHQPSRTAIPSVVTTDVDSTSDGQEKILTRPAATDQSQVVSSSSSDVRSYSPSALIQQPLVPSSSSESDDAQPPKPNSCYVSPTRGRRPQQRPPSSSPSFDNSSTDGDRVKPYKRNYCSKTFWYPSSLLSHCKVHFPPEFKCDFCHKMFTHKFNRDWHMNTHTGAKPYGCIYCSKTFSCPRNLLSHRKVHFPPEFKCDFCPKMFTRKYDRDQHLKTHTREPKLKRVLTLPQKV